jgi:hypothetical protein
LKHQLVLVNANMLTEPSRNLLEHVGFERRVDADIYQTAFMAKVGSQ